MNVSGTTHMQYPILPSSLQTLLESVRAHTASSVSLDTCLLRAKDISSHSIWQLPSKVLFNAADFWQQQIEFGKLCYELSRLSGSNELPARAFTAGLLHDIGWWLLAKWFLPEYHLIQRLHSRSPHIPRTVFSQRVLGLGCAQDFLAGGCPGLGAWLLKKWGVEEQITEAVRLHTELDLKPAGLTGLIRLGQAIMNNQINHINSLAGHLGLPTEAVMKLAEPYLELEDHKDHKEHMAANLI